MKLSDPDSMPHSSCFYIIRNITSWVYYSLFLLTDCFPFTMSSMEYILSNINYVCIDLVFFHTVIDAVSIDMTFEFQPN